MTIEERRQKIESYGNAYVQLTEALRQFPKDMWMFKPSPDRWSVHEILIHLADSEANAFVKCRKLIAEPGKSVMAYDQDIWSKALHYHDQSTEDALELFKLLRLTTYKLIRSLHESVWANSKCRMENESVTLGEWLELYERHIPEHINQMKKNHDEWKKRHQQ